MRYLLMMALMTILQPSSYANEPAQELDDEFLEFLSLYDPVDEDLIDQVMDEETTNSDSGKNSTKQIEEAN